MSSEGETGAEAEAEAEGAGGGGRPAKVPNIASEDPQERIAARRLRIAARQEAKRREALGEDPDAHKLVEEEQTRSHKQIEDSRQRLTKLLFDGTQLVTNIQVAADSREAQRRAEEEELNRQRVEKLENEAKANQDKFNEITSKWGSTKEKIIPQELWEGLNTQQMLCAQLIEEKNKLISELQQELKSKDDQYVKDLRKQTDDINLLLERMEEQIRNLMKSYRRELLQIEKAFELERRELLTSNKKKWEQAMQQLNRQELDFMMARLKKVEEYERELNQLRVQDAEEYNVIKIKLEHDVQILEQQLQQMKAIYQLNQEKLEYNFQVLKKRDEENTIIKSQQKRKLNRLHDILNNLRLKFARQIKQYREENVALTADYKRIVQQYKDLQRTMRHFAIVDAEHFLDVWLMNEEEAKGLIRKVFSADRVIQAQQLGLHWTEPDSWFLHNVGPIVHSKKMKSASELAREVIAPETSKSFALEGSSRDDKEATPEEDRQGPEGTEPEVKALWSISTKTVKHILELLCDESGFLIESKLRGLLQPLEKHDRTLMRLDSIFMALSIDSEDDVYQLVQFFRNFKAQQVAANPELEEFLVDSAAKEKPEEVETVEESEGSAAPQDEGKVPSSPAAPQDTGKVPSGSLAPQDKRKVPSGSLAPQDKGKVPSSSAAPQDTGKVPSGSLAPQDKGKVPSSSAAPQDEGKVPSGSSALLSALYMHPNDILRALKAFVQEFQEPREKRPQVKKAPKERDDSKDSEYWDALAHAIPDVNLKLWDALVSGLHKYHHILDQRAKLITETDGLRQQNTELRMLLHQYLQSPVNAELLIPPTHLLHLQMNT